MTFAHLALRGELETWIGSAMEANERGTEINFAIINEASQSAVGATSFYRVVPEHKRLELGKTWLGAPYRRTHINTAAKYLMLSHAFETISANRVELNTDARTSDRNEQWSDWARFARGFCAVTRSCGTAMFGTLSRTRLR